MTNVTLETYPTRASGVDLDCCFADVADAMKTKMWRLHHGSVIIMKLFLRVQIHCIISIATCTKSRTHLISFFD
ncbi:hypothetical protein HanPSC8_Chr08g0333081 [Helianthus annuus]|nr:hypothetical protein HanPSC8_Chr08g0333081 [Helianthus annuus]